MSLDDSVQDDDVQIPFEELTVLISKGFYRSLSGKLKIDFVEGRGITVELTK